MELIIYDASGRIIQSVSGSVSEPVGIPFIWVDIPYGKYIKQIDVSNSENHKPIFEDFPKTELQLLSERQAESELEIDYRLSLLELELI